MARHARQKCHDSKEFFKEKTLYIPGGSQVIDCNYFFSKKNQVFIFPYFIKIKTCHTYLLKERHDLLSLYLDCFCT